jgi:hypothetical protein
MSRWNFVQFLTNTDKNGSPVPNVEVEAPAFSITKVLTTASLVLTPLSAVLVNAFEGDDFNFQPWHIVTLTLGVLGFLAITASSDVLARARCARPDAGSAAERRDERDTANLIPFTKPLPGALTDGGREPHVDVLAATGGSKAYFLVKRQNGSIDWLPVDKVELR